VPQHRNVLAAIAVVAALLLSGCTSGALAVAASGSPTTSPAASPSASEKPDDDDDDDDDDDRADRSTRDGIGGDITITAISGSSVSLRTVDGWTRTITVTAETEITKGGQPIAAGDLRVGDEVRLRQQRLDDGTYSIVAIRVVVPRIKGEVTAVGTSSMALRLRDDTTQQVTLTSSTAYQLGDAEATKADVRVGSRVTVAGTVGANDSFTAITVSIKLEKVSGTVTARTFSGITLQRRNGETITVHVDGSTQYAVRGVETATLADVAIGVRAAAAGQLNADGSLDAVWVAAKRPKTPDQASPSPSPSPS
jgi:hypothetical protein